MLCTVIAIINNNIPRHRTSSKFVETSSASITLSSVFDLYLLCRVEPYSPTEITEFTILELLKGFSFNYKKEQRLFRKTYTP